MTEIIRGSIGQPSCHGASARRLKRAGVRLSDLLNRTNFWSPRRRPLEGGPSSSGECRARPEHPVGRVYILWSALRHSLINAFRSSPLRDLALASALHIFIFSYWVMGLASPLRQEDMNALRSSPFLSPAWVLHAFMRSCCGFDFFSSAPEATESLPATNDIATAIASTVLMSPSSLNVEAAAQPQGSEPSRSSGPLPAPSFSRPGAGLDPSQENTRAGGRLADVGHRHLP